jgi:multicomponent Na+:H+ antiporter subunit E
MKRKADHLMKKRNGAILLFILLIGFWFILSTKIDLTIAIIGFFASCLVIFYNFDLIFNDQEATKITLRSIRSFFVLVIVLLVNIIKSNVEVALIVLNPKLPIKPGFDQIRNPLKKELNQALYANAITLTPGTLSVEVTDEYIIVHGLNVDHVKHIEGSKLEKVFVDFEGESI